MDKTSSRTGSLWIGDPRRSPSSAGRVARGPADNPRQDRRFPGSAAFQAAVTPAFNQPHTHRAFSTATSADSKIGDTAGFNPALRAPTATALARWPPRRRVLCGESQRRLSRESKPLWFESSGTSGHPRETEVVTGSSPSHPPLTGCQDLAKA